MSTLRFGFIGAGQIAYSSANSIKNHGKATVIAASDPNAERLNELCTKFEIPHAHATSEELFANPEVDAVYIAVPNKFHAPLAKAALEAGKHVILDKPFALSYAEALGVAEAARCSGKVLTLGMNVRFLEGAQKIRSLVEQGVLGEVYHAKAYWQRRTGIPKLGTWFGNKELAGGGCLYDIGVHALDACLYVMGNFKPVSVSGVTYTKFGNRGLGEGGWGMSDRSKDIIFNVDDFASALIRFENGATVSLDVSWAAHMENANRQDIELFGTEAGAVVWSPKLFRHDPLRTEYDVIENPAAPLRYPHKDRFANFINHILDGEELCVTVDQALAIQKILDGIAESCVTGREVML